MSMSPLPHEVEDWVHDVLLHYGDSARLCTSPLLDHLTSADLPMEDRVGELRAELRRAIESLRPPDTVPYGHADWLLYRILWGRCIQRRSPIQICDELALSRATFYRYQVQAIRAVALVLREHVSPYRMGASEAGAASDAQPPGEAAWPDATHRQAVDVRALLDDVQRTMSSLLERQGVTLRVSLSEGATAVLADPDVLRQVLLNALAGVLRAGVGPLLELGVAVSATEVTWVIEGAPAEEALEAPNANDFPELALCSTLLRPYGGSVTWAVEEDKPRLRLALPASRPPTVLVVEDDADTIAVYERYLRRAGLSLRLARDSAQLWDQLEEGRPDLILLDVLMPKEDGWLVLQRLQTLPETADIPVIVCSVLAQPSLALSLGARQVLLKPISEAALLQAVRQVLRQEDSERRPHR